MGSVVWKSFLRFSGTVVAGILGLGALYFSVLCNGLSFENHPAKVRLARVAGAAGGPALETTGSLVPCCLEVDIVMHVEILPHSIPSPPP